MLQVAFIRNNRELVKEKLAVKNFGNISIVEKVIELDDERKKLQFEFDETQSKLNATSKEIGQLMASGKKETAEEKKKEVATLKSHLQPINEKLIEIEKSLHDELVQLPNLPHSSVPKGKTPEENEVVREGGQKPMLEKEALPHWELAKKYDLINFELGNKVTGAAFLFIKIKAQNCSGVSFNIF